MDGTRKLASLAAVAALHVAIVAALLSLSHGTVGVPNAASETIIWFLPAPPKKIPKPAQNMSRPAGPIAAPHSTLPSYRGITIPAAPPPAAALSGLNNSLFGCADLDKLSPEAQARCGSALMQPGDSVDLRDGTARSQQAALWEHGRLRKNGPLLLPCMSPQAPNILGTLACLAKGAAAGEIKPEDQPSYADKPEILHLPNNGDPPDHPTGF